MQNLQSHHLEQLPDRINFWLVLDWISRMAALFLQTHTQKVKL